MKIEIAREKAEQAWQTPKNKRTGRDTFLAAAFADILVRETESLEKELQAAWGLIAALRGRGMKIEVREKPPARKTRVCFNCRHWHKKEYIHCQHSGPWGGDISNDPNCTFESKWR